MGKHLVLIGGGHAHMVTLANLYRFIQNGHQVTVVGPSEFHYYSGMGPGMLGQTYSPRQIRFATRKVVEKQGGQFIQDTVSHIDPQKQIIITDTGATIQYDLLSFNVGSYVPSKLVEGDQNNVYTVKPIEGLIDAQQKIVEHASMQHVRVAIIGGGAAGVEIAGNAWHLLSKYGCRGFDIRLYCQRDLLHRFPAKIRSAAMTSLQQRDIKIFEHHLVHRIKNNHIDLKSGQIYQANIIFLAVGVQPSPIFKDSGLRVGPDGGLEVNRYLQSPAYPNIFGGGDCIFFKNQPLNKVGVYAVRQNPILYHNLTASIADRPLKPFSPGGAYLLIFNLGGGAGIFYKKGIMFRGRMAFWIKDLIDRKFMRKFQSIESRPQAVGIIAPNGETVNHTIDQM